MILHRILPVFATIMLVITALGLQSCTVVKVVEHHHWGSKRCCKSNG